MIRSADSLLLRRLFLEYGFENHIAAKQYATHHIVQDWLFKFLFDRGLKPSHNFLDIGCGWLRLAQALLPYLEDGRYYGIDAVETHLAMGRKFLEQSGVTEKPVLLCNADFGFDAFGTEFDFAISHAVFTHLTHPQIERCLTELKKVMRPGTIAYCTFYLSRTDRERRSVYKLSAADPLEFGSAQVSVGFFAELFRRLDLSWEYLGRCGHPTGQHVIAIRFAPPDRRLRPVLVGAVRRTARVVRSGVDAILGE